MDLDGLNIVTSRNPCWYQQHLNVKNVFGEILRANTKHWDGYVDIYLENVKNLTCV